MFHGLFRNVSMVKRFLYSFSIIIIIQSFSFLFIYKMVVDAFYASSIETGLLNVKKGVDYFEKKLDDFDRLNFFMASERDFFTFSRLSELQQSDYVKMMKISELTQMYTLNNELIGNMFIWFDNSKTFKTNTSMVTSDSESYRGLYFFDKANYVDFFSKEFRSDYNIALKNVEYKDSKGVKQAVLYLNKSDVVSSGVVSAIEVNMDSVYSTFCFLPEHFLDSFEIVTQGNVTVYRKNQPGKPAGYNEYGYGAGFDVDRKNNIVKLHYKSDYKNLLYVLNISNNYFLDYINPIKGVLAFIYIITLFLTASVSYLLSNLNYSPVKKLMNSLSLTNVRTDELSHIHNAIDSMKYQILMLDEEVKEQSGIVERLFETDILEGAVFYPVELELKLINSCLAGNYDQASDIVKELFEKNFSGVTDEMVIKKKCMQISVAFRWTFIRIITFMTQDESGAMELNFGYKYTSVNEIRERALSIFHNLCFFINESKTKLHDELLTDIIRYLDEHYIDPNISLTAVVDKFSVTENYISKLLRENGYENFSSYIEKLRMKRAMELITETKLPFQDIALAVGYFNVNSFYKAFKRVNNAAPGCFRRKE